MQINETKHINECLASVMADLCDRHAAELKQWPLVARNKAITARNRFFAEHGEWLGFDTTPMPLEVPHGTGEAPMICTRCQKNPRYSARLICSACIAANACERRAAANGGVARPKGRPKAANGQGPQRQRLDAYRPGEINPLMARMASVSLVIAC